jgi:hypothetical protein
MAHFRHFESGGDNVKVNPCPGSIKVTTHFFLAPTEAGGWILNLPPFHP